MPKRNAVRAYIASLLVPLIGLGLNVSIIRRGFSLLSADCADPSVPSALGWCLHAYILGLGLVQAAVTAHLLWRGVRAVPISLVDLADRGCWTLTFYPALFNSLLAMVVPGYVMGRDWLTFLSVVSCIGVAAHLTPSRSLLQIACIAPCVIFFDYLKQCSTVAPGGLPACGLAHAASASSPAAAAAAAAAAGCDASAFAQCGAGGMALHALRRGFPTLLYALLPAAVLHGVFIQLQQQAASVHDGDSSQGGEAAAAAAAAAAVPAASAAAAAGGGGGGGFAAARAWLHAWMDRVDGMFERLARGVDPSLALAVLCVPLALYYFCFAMLCSYFPETAKISSISSEEWLLVMVLFFMLGRYSCSFDMLPLVRHVQAQLTASFAKQAQKPSLLELMDSVRQQVLGNSQGELKDCVETLDDGPEDQIRILEMLGEGMSGKVYRGLWRGTVVAVKSMILPSKMGGASTRERMAIMEAAISSALSHPNIVQTYTYSVKPVRDASRTPTHQDLHLTGLSGWSDTAAAWTEHETGPSSRTDVSQEHPASSIGSSGSHGFEVCLVLEYADCGTLRDALDRGTFFASDGAAPAEDTAEGRSSAGAEAARSSGGTPAPARPGHGSYAHEPGQSGRTREVDYESVLRTVADIAKGMLHLHALNVVHSDLKARNVLLLSSASDPRGFTAKVSDFGLSFKMDATDTHVSNMFQVLLNGYQGKAADVYAFGITMWEVFTGGHPFQGMAKALLGHFVAEQGLRPAFAASAPPEYVALATRCWSAEPSARPSFEGIVASLTDMLAAATEQRLQAEPCSEPLSRLQDARQLQQRRGLRKSVRDTGGH